MIYRIRNTRTGWEGAVPERIYHDRMRYPNEYEDLTHRQTAAPKASYTPHDKGGGWYDVLGPDGEPVNEKALRKAAAEAMAAKLSA